MNSGDVCALEVAVAWDGPGIEDCDQDREGVKEEWGGGCGIREDTGAQHGAEQGVATETGCERPGAVGGCRSSRRVCGSRGGTRWGWGLAGVEDGAETGEKEESAPAWKAAERRPEALPTEGIHGRGPLRARVSG